MLILSVFPVSAAQTGSLSLKVSYLESSPDEASADEAQASTAPSTDAPTELPSEPIEITETFTQPESVEPEYPPPSEPPAATEQDGMTTLPPTTSEPTPVIPATETPTQAPTHKEPTTDVPTSTDPTESVKPASDSKKTASVVNLNGVSMCFNILTGTMRAGKTLQLYVINSGRVKFSSSNKKVAVINKKGKVTTLRKGFARITAKSGKKKCYCTIKVVSDPKLNKSSVKIKKGRSKKITLTGKAPSVKLKFKNTKKAKITSKNTKSYIKVKAKKRGKTTVRVRVNGKWLRLKVIII